MNSLSEEDTSISTMPNIDLETYINLDKKQKEDLLMYGLYVTHLLEQFKDDDIDLFLSRGQITFKESLSFDEIEIFRNNDKLNQILPFFVAHAVKNGFEIKNHFLFQTMSNSEKIEYYTSIIKNNVPLSGELKIEFNELKCLHHQLIPKYFEYYATENDILNKEQLDELKTLSFDFNNYVKFIDRMALS